MAQKLPLDTLVELARRNTDDAARRLGVLHSATVSAGQKLDLLLRYRDDYSEQLQALMRQGLPSSQWRNYQAFLATLDGAIEQQRATRTQADHRLDHGRDDWRHHKRRLNSFDVLSERSRQQELAVLGKREQRDSDERATRKFLDRAVNPMS